MADGNLWRDRNKVFVAGIPLDADDAALGAKFQAFGEMFQAKVVYDSRTGNSRGFGFITFREYVDALEAVAQMNQSKWGKRVLNVRFLQPKNGEGQGEGGGNGHANGAGAAPTARRPVKVFGPCPEGCTSVYAGNLAYDITEEVVRKVFAKCGDVKAVRFAEHMQTQEFRGFGYVQFYDGAACERAVAMDGMIVMGRPITLDYGARDEATERAREALQLKLKKGVCHKFQQGQCSRGDDCKFAHVREGAEADAVVIASATAQPRAPIRVGAAMGAPPPPLTAVEDGAPVCINFQKGKCQRGAACRFQHLGAVDTAAGVVPSYGGPEEEVAEEEDDDGTPICQNFQKGKCKRGDACRFRHVVPRAVVPVAAAVMPQTYAAPQPEQEAEAEVEADDDDTPICQNFQKGKCKRGDACRFRHLSTAAAAAAAVPAVPAAVRMPTTMVQEQQEQEQEPEQELELEADAADDTPICQNFQKGTCKRGAGCRFRHVEASALVAEPPRAIAAADATAAGSAPRPRTTPSTERVAITVSELPAVSLCHNFQRGRCTRGGSCRFAHALESDTAAVARAQASADADARARAKQLTTRGTEYQKRFQSVCYNWQNTRSCARGAQCQFHHEGAEQEVEVEMEERHGGRKRKADEEEEDEHEHEKEEEEEEEEEKKKKKAHKKEKKHKQEKKDKKDKKKKKKKERSSSANDGMED